MSSTTLTDPVSPSEVSGQRPLFVDMDDTLLEGDTLWESLAVMVRRNPKGLFAVAASLPKGRVAFKQAVARNVDVTLEDFKVNEGVLSFIQEAGAHRPVILATAAHEQIARRIADDTGVFQDVIATTDGKNLKSGNKLVAIQDYLKAHEMGPAFDYIGDCGADRPIWAAAGRAHVCAGSDAQAADIAGIVPVEKSFHREAPSARHFIKAMRPHQWVKNFLIFLPVILAHEIFNFDKVLPAIVAFIAFSLTASATYMWNDILDIQADRAHAKKCKRPFAASLIPIPLGVAFSLALIAFSCLITLIFCPPATVLVILGYIAITLSYSLDLKRRLMLDVIVLGVLYGYRIMLGGVATGIAVSSWLIGFSVFFFFGLALVKRYTEIEKKPPGEDGRIAGRAYYSSDREVVGVIGIVASFISVLVMALYITSPTVAVLYSRPEPLWTVCLVLIYWISRVWMLTHRGHMPDDPIVFALKDKVSIMCGIVCAVAVAAAL
ncbi:UbiA family prenyltransferase [Parvularcula sp. LCG005]|uniref:UbiA family prenyltransferase n=1 Tax=Parvularcula sp. LCG005 TaxID=3078805 RepID=UPI0029428E43|nr:UbiA family prenyltransferase [Parvularcula sp. LCG005]WOI53733.1 UbiA family prenyltransferase [Parvularcula sp. LCG005]